MFFVSGPRGFIWFSCNLSSAFYQPAVQSWDTYDMRSPPSAIDGTARILEAADLSGTIVAHNEFLVVTVALPHSKSKDPEDPEDRLEKTPRRQRIHTVQPTL